MTTAESLLEDLSRARERVHRQVEEDPDHLVALEMFRADVRRARQAIEQYASFDGPTRVMGGQVVEVKG